MPICTKHLLLTALLAAAYPLQAAAQSQPERLLFPMADGDTLIVANDYGSVRIRVRAGDDPNGIVRIRRNAADASRLREVETIAQKVADKLFVQAYFYDYRAESVALEILVPSSVNVQVSGANPSVEVEEVEGWVRVNTLTGNVRGRNLRGAVSLQSDTGGVEYQSEVQPFKEIRLESVAGRVSCTMAQGLRLRAWMRAGGRLNFNDEVELTAGQMERQVGDGGPLIYAGSLRGNVRFRLGELYTRAVSAPSARSRDQADRDDRAADRTPTLRTSSGPESASGSRDSRSAPEDLGRRTASNRPSDDRGYEMASDEEQQAAVSAPSFKVDVNWINLNVSVRDRVNNRSIPRLSKEDFLVYEDGIEQSLERFESTEAPISLLLLLDVSGSTEDYIDLIRRASIDFIQQIKNNDQVAVAIFNSRVRLIQGFTGNRRRAAQKIRRIRADGGTAFYDALWTSIHDYMAPVQGRKAIVVFSDGIDNQLTSTGQGSDVTFPELFRAVQEADTIIYPIFLETNNSARSAPRRGGSQRRRIIDILGDIARGGGARIGLGGGAQEEARRQMEAIAEQTGGRMYSPGRADDLRGVFTQIADDLRVQYFLVYASNNPNRDGRWREIEIRIRDHRDWVARTRRGYYAPAGGSPQASPRRNFLPNRN